MSLRMYFIKKEQIVCIIYQEIRNAELKLPDTLLLICVFQYISIFLCTEHCSILVYIQYRKKSIYIDKFM